MVHRFWGLVAIGFALFAHLVENLIQAVNILGSIFYGVMLGLFVVAFFVQRVGGTAVFWAALVAQALVFVLYFNLDHFLSLVSISSAAPRAWCSAWCLQTVLGGDAKANQNARDMTRSRHLFWPATVRIFPEAVSCSPKSRPRGGCKAKSAAKLFSSITTATTIRAKRRTILRHRKTNEPAQLNFAFENKIQRKFSPLYLKRIPAGWQDKTALQLPNYVESSV